MGKELKKRSEVRKEFTWATEDIYPSDQAWQEDLNEAKKLKDHMLELKGKLGGSAGDMLEFYQLYDQITIKLDSLFNYASRKKDEDTKNATYQAMHGNLMAVYVEITQALSFEDPELIAIPEVIIQRFFEEKPALRLYQRHIEVKRRKKDHVLSQAEEKILAAATDLSAAPGEIFGMFNNADLQFPEIVDEDGDKVRITHGNFIPFMDSADRRVRKDAFEGLYSVYRQFQNTSAATLNAQMKQLQFYAKMRNYNSTLEAALDDTEVPVSVYHNLIEAVSDQVPVMHRYVELRKKILKVDELHMYDLYTPMIQEMNAKIDYEEAKDTILKALVPLGEDYIATLKHGFENRWVDVYENEGKRSGAYSAGAKVHPFVLMNYADTIDSMFTLAHEMGHAMHSYLSNKHQPNIYSDYTIFVAEVASTCNESLLMQYLLKNTEDKQKKAYLINHFLDKFRTTLYRQTMFAEFELLLNQLVEDGESLTAQVLNDIYHSLNVKYYGDHITVDSQIDVEWARIPHFYYNYYVFQYATGFSAAIALSNRILKEGEPAVKDYLKFLSGGSSADPISLLKIAGVDMSTPQPVNEALSLFDSLITELEKIMEE